jgi:hypothetical protein
MRVCQFDTAAEHLRQTISLDPGRTGAFILLGAVMEIRGGKAKMEHENRREGKCFGVNSTTPLRRCLIR